MPSAEHLRSKVGNSRGNRLSGTPRRAGMALLLGCAGLLLASCSSQMTNSLEDPGQVDLSAKTPRKIVNRGEGAAGKMRAPGTRYEVFTGSQAPIGEEGEEPAPGVGTQEDGKFTINVDQASLAEASKLILGETLGYNYTIDPRVQGTVTLVGNRPLSARELLSAFEASLRLSGATLIQSEGIYKVVALQEVLDGEMGRADLEGSISSGYGVSAVPLRFVSPNTLMELMDGFIARSGTARASKSGNMILIRGPAEERRALVEVVLSFDVDWMQTQTASLALLENGRADDVAAKLEAIFAEDTAAAGSNALKVIPVPRLNGLVVIANTSAKVKRAIGWIKRLDQESDSEPNYYVYAVQNGNSADLARILNATFGSGAGATAEVAPDKQTMAVTMGAGDGANGQPAQGGDAAQQQAQPPADDGTGAAASSASEAGDESSYDAEGGIRITSNPANNTLVIRATPRDYRKILSTLRQIDAPATQVLINTTIAEVQLNEQLRYGVQAYFANNHLGGGMFGSGTTQASTTLKTTFPGMNFFLGGISDPRIVVDALSGITKVRVVSSPSVLVLENETATIKVGDQVPVQTQNAFSNSGEPIASYEYRDTGVILKVRPRVNANGMVNIELGQELSSVNPKAAGTVASNPSFTQRSITSKVSVNDQQTVLLGGLISGREDRAKDSVPGVNRVPVLGGLLGKTDNSSNRTELIVFITPKIIRNGEDAARESQDLRQKMKNLSIN